MTADQRRAGLAELTRLDEEMQAPAEAHGFDAAGFRAWVLANLPDDTIIGSSAWWADHLSTWASRFAKPQPKGMVLSDEQIFAAWNRASGIAEAGERRLAFGREVERLTLSAQAPASDAPDENVERWREVLQKAAQTVSGFGNFFAGSKHREPVGSKMHQHYANWAKQATEMVNELMDLSDEIRDTLGDDHE